MNAGDFFVGQKVCWMSTTKDGYITGGTVLAINDTSVKIEWIFVNLKRETKIIDHDFDGPGVLMRIFPANNLFKTRREALEAIARAKIPNSGCTVPKSLLHLTDTGEKGTKRWGIGIKPLTIKEV